ncbi:hypothetical protein [Pseudomonas sp. KK4]|uniref:hypothetical protein n=1 Tax=Pseudomonas sp. KK4 TaxID=1855729 RepID=UPI00097BE54A|nr:hypothetical protein [Pseudomonas sp. KK4]
MPLVIERPSQLYAAIVAALRDSTLGINIGSREDSIDVSDQPWVSIAIDRDATDSRASDGRIAHVLTVSLQAVVDATAVNPSLAACDLTSALKDLVTDNRWGLPIDQCDLPSNLDALPSLSASGMREHNAWTLTFTQTLYFGAPVLDDPLGTPKFARTWEVSSIDDPDQYTELED